MSAKTLKIFMQNGQTIYGQSYPKLSMQELKEFKDSDPNGYEELSKASELLVSTSKDE